MSADLEGEGEGEGRVGGTAEETGGHVGGGGGEGGSYEDMRMERMAVIKQFLRDHERALRLQEKKEGMLFT